MNIRARDGGAAPGDARIVLAKEEPIAGQAIGPDNRPVGGAVVCVWVKHYQFLVPRPSGTSSNPNYGFPIEVKTDAEGRYVLRGLPAGVKLDWFEIRHPEYRMVQEGRRVLRGGESNDFKLAAGCKVSGSSLTKRGGRSRGRKFNFGSRAERGGIPHSTRTGLDGRFRFGNVDAGPMDGADSASRARAGARNGGCHRWTARLKASTSRDQARTSAAGWSELTGSRLKGPRWAGRSRWTSAVKRSKNWCWTGSRTHPRTARSDSDRLAQGSYSLTGLAEWTSANRPCDREGELDGRGDSAQA